MILQIYLALSAIGLIYYLITRTRSGHFDLRFGLAFDRLAAPRTFLVVQMTLIILAGFLIAVAAGALGSLQ